MIITIITLIAIVVLSAISVWLIKNLRPSFKERTFIASVALLPKDELKPLLWLKNPPTTSELLASHPYIPSSHAYGSIKLADQEIGRLEEESLKKFNLAVDEKNEYELGKRIRYEGRINAPKKVYEGDSKNITIDLQPLFVSSIKNLEDNQNGKQTDFTPIELDVIRQKKNEFLEFELIAAGLDVDGDKKQKQSLNFGKLQFQWSCLFSKSGYHKLAFVARLINANNVIDIDRIELSVFVSKLDHLTQRQVWILATLGGVTSGILAIIEVLHQLGIF